MNMGKNPMFMTLIINEYWRNNSLNNLFQKRKCDNQMLVPMVTQLMGVFKDWWDFYQSYLLI